ncbi:uracil-DNA glycosylase [Shewanella schlegeliana]|uniref:Uracil-DNA glycosylase n=1 Tax=Shewanella schlegeliana TaxID=190308 RepID=A0ABS1T0T3_9GAMM|nr:uracil-DNA glycosylase [Shewanella schlegeliana]MBL4914393.1 uracil-DNA glycosylase [Shewanella schlegeliana]MCL1109383.1 uracil-DNA glycosylase [Shewanella schlegeliana]GIU31850.1 uracil-DNA glycosylase [Shewanella schlegeliana]
MAAHSSWQSFINEQQQQAYFQSMQQFVEGERAAGKVIYPPESEVLTAFDSTPLDKVRVVLIGQDPYHGPDQAHGLCFSVKHGVKTPPSLVNMYKELASDIDGFTIPAHGNLSRWAEQGVLMLNTVLTVEQGKAHSHAKSGWETFTANALALLNEQPQPIIFVLWGAHAIKKGKGINASQHQIISGPHPSPLSAYRGFFGCKHFSKINEILQARDEQPIDWQV